ncbi:MAG TPA: ABC transporter substrate-binding protein [Burkholderiales bacterium]|nr:ABC transporter substrate-binding protein [Burkholderiales bacterium]
MTTGRVAVIASLAGLLIAASPAAAEKKYGPGVTDTEIRIGQTMPYSGPNSAYGTYGKAQLAFFRMLNEHGGINGRKITLLSLDDGYSPPRTVEQIRKLVEQEQVLMIFSSFGTPTNAAIVKYLNAKKVPHLFVTSGGAEFADAKLFPWTMGWRVNYVSEGRVYGNYLRRTRPDARIAVLYQHDDVGRDYLRGLREGLGERAQQMIVAEASYEITDPTVDSQVISLRASGADTFFHFGSPKPTAQAIRKIWDIGWRPLQFVSNPSASVATVMKPAGLERSVGIISGAYLKDPTDSHWQTDPGYKEWLAFMKQYYPDGDTEDLYNVYAYGTAATLVQVLKQCGDDLTRENVLRQAESLKNLELPVLLPGIRVNTGPQDHSPVEQMQLQRFDGKQWALFGEIISP